MEFKDIFEKSEKVCEYAEAFLGSKVEDFKISKEQKKIETVIRPQKIVDKEIIMVVAKDIRVVYDLNSIKIYTRYSPEMFSEEYYPQIVKYISLKMPALRQYIQNSSAVYENETLKIHLASNGADILSSTGAKNEIKKLVSDEFSLEIEVEIFDGCEVDQEKENEEYLRRREEELRLIIEEEQRIAEERAEIQREINKEKRAEQRRLNAEERERNAHRKMIFGRPQDGEINEMQYVTENSGSVLLEGEIFYTEEKKTKNETIIFIMYMTDGTGSVIVKKFYKDKEKFAQEKGALSVGTCIRLYGKAELDKFSNECMIQ